MEPTATDPRRGCRRLRVGSCVRRGGHVRPRQVPVRPQPILPLPPGSPRRLSGPLANPWAHRSGDRVDVGSVWWGSMGCSWDERRAVPSGGDPAAFLQYQASWGLFRIACPAPDPRCDAHCIPENIDARDGRVRRGSAVADLSDDEPFAGGVPDADVRRQEGLRGMNDSRGQRGVFRKVGEKAAGVEVRGPGAMHPRL